MTKLFQTLNARRLSLIALEVFVVAILPVLVAMKVLGLWDWDLSIPLVYSNADDIWQLVLTKMVRDTGWILENPFLGAPDIAHWQYHSAAQTSSLHSIVMRAMSLFIDDAVKIQQVYYVLNFSLISISAYLACRLLGVARFAAGAIGFLFAFTSFRIGWMFYAFLANYAAVPLAFVPVFWTITGEYAKLGASAQTTGAALKLLSRSPKFWAGLLFSLLVTLSDGYYAFFTLLILAFAICVRTALGDLRRPVRLLAPLVFIFAIISLALSMTAPLKAYQRAHVSEFSPGGKEDPALVKHPMEAEVYSSSLKLMLAPITEHRVAAMAELGKTMVASSDAARKFPVGKPIVSLGSIGGILLIVVLVLLPILALRHMAPSSAQNPTWLGRLDPTVWAAIGLSYFLFLCSISGGVGTLVALIYPTIRAYDRLALFLMFALFVGAGAAATSMLRGAAKTGLIIALVAAAALTVVGLYDQIPYNAQKGDQAKRTKYLAERSFVRGIEHQLPPGAMVYQYPHSQYLSDSKYYGWGSFLHLRLYLHSEKLRWSNGGSKNSGIEIWHDKIAGLPIDKLVDEIEAAGFRGFVIDRAVVPLPEYQAVKAALAARGMVLVEDAASALAFAKVKDPGYQVVYEPDFGNVSRLRISDVARTRAAKLPRMINSPALNAYLDKAGTAVELDRAGNPQLFLSSLAAERGMGVAPILPLTDMAGALRCDLAPRSANDGPGDAMVLTISNRSAFDWKFDGGRMPLKVGVHMRTASGEMLRWDDGYRLAVDAYVPSGGQTQVRVPLRGVSRAGLGHEKDMVAEFGVVQDGHAWFDNLRCQLALAP